MTVLASVIVIGCIFVLLVIVAFACELAVGMLRVVVRYFRTGVWPFTDAQTPRQIFWALELPGIVGRMHRRREHHHRRHEKF